jgi:phosphoribosylformylglycinamidine (FGAM) synthase PurS component
MHRIEISLKNHVPDARGLGLVEDIADLGIKSVTAAKVTDMLLSGREADPKTVGPDRP